MAPLPALSARNGVEELVLRHRPLARHLAQRYVRATDQREDLEQVACLGLVKAAQRFDPDRGTAFTTFAVPTILGELRRHCRDTRWAWHVPRRVQERVQALRRLEDEWQSRRGRPPSASDAARALGCAEEDIIDARLAAATLAPDSLNAGTRSADGVIGETIDRLGREDRGFEAAERRDTLSRALARLDDRGRRALRLRAEANLTTPEIAACMGLSPSQAGRLVAKSLQRLRAALDEEEQLPPRVASRSVAVRAAGAATTFAEAA
jgi:RNA polymerase sigma-B factor